MTETFIVLYLLARTYLGWRIEFMERLIKKLSNSWIMKEAVKIAATIELIFTLLSGRVDRKNLEPK